MSDEVLDRIVAWGDRQTDIRALVMTGSRAREDGSADGLSDYDIEVFTTDRATYESDSGWIGELGEVWVCLALPVREEDGYLMRLVVFEGGLNVDFGIAPLDVLADTVAGRQLNDLYERGYRVLLDKDGLAAQLVEPAYEGPLQLPPAEEEFRAAVEEFWFEAFHIPKLLQRNDLWVAKLRDWTMKQRLLEMIEWHATATKGERHDVWHIGKRMADWTTPEVWERLHGVFGRFDAADGLRALHATVELYRDLARETATAFGFVYPSELDDAISKWLTVSSRSTRKRSSSG